MFSVISVGYVLYLIALYNVPIVVQRFLENPSTHKEDLSIWIKTFEYILKVFQPSSLSFFILS
jgi:hypothetical protein